MTKISVITFFVILIFSSCIVIKKNNINRFPAVVTAGAGTNLFSERQFGINGLFEFETLDMHLVNQRDRQIVNIHIDTRRSTLDTIFFSGVRINYEKTDQLYFEAFLPARDLRRFSVTNDGFFEQRLVFDSAGINVNGKQSDSLLNFFLSESPLNIAGLNTNFYERGLLKTYSGNLRDRAGNTAGFYAQTDPFPLILVVIAAAVAWKVSSDKNAGKEKYREGRCDGICNGKGTVVKGVNSGKYFCVCKDSKLQSID